MTGQSDPRAARVDGNRETERLREALTVCLAQLDATGIRAVEDACARHPDLADRIRRAVHGLGTAGLLAGAGGEFPVSEFPERLGEFRLLRRLGGGGMGMVYLARQESLGRDVALKIVRPDHLYFEGARSRFQREIEAVARLRHEDIVPILSVGEQEGLPYFAMEWVEGCSLAEALAEVARASKDRTLEGGDLARAVRTLASAADDDDAHGLFAGSWSQVVLRIVRRVAHALHHAHERGIVHRDVKPSNIMLTPGGRVLLLDFGLARLEGFDEITRAGSTLGSLPYMSPEQLRGGSELDARVDVYSLGVTLYEALTRRLPFVAADTEQLRRAILAGVPARPRSHDPSIPRDVETVCLKAMDIERTRRYRSMAELARDLANCLELRPIEARHAGQALRARRWVQRNPAAGVAVGLGLLLVVGAPSALWLQQRNANARLTQESTRAAQNLGHALGAVHEMLTVVSETQLRETPHVKSVRLGLLDRARRFFEAFLVAEGDDQGVRTHAATVLSRLGLLQLELGRPEDALESMARARELLVTSTDRDDGDIDDLLTFATCLRATGKVHLERRQLERAEAAYDEALERLDRALAESPQSNELVESRSRTLDALAVLRSLQDRTEESIDLRQTAVDSLEQLVATAPRELRWRAALGGVYTNHALALNRSGRDGLEAARRATELLEDVVREDRSQKWRASLAKAHLALGDQFTSSDRIDDGERHYRRALEIAEELACDYPWTPDYLWEIGRNANNVGQILIARGQLEAAREVLERAIAAQRRALEIVPDHPPYLEALRNHYVNLCDALMHPSCSDELHAITEALASLRPDSASTAQDAAYEIMRLAHLVAGADLSPGDRERWLEDEHRRAMRYLELAAERGLPPETLDDDWLDPLRGRPEFEVLEASVRAR